MSTFLIHTLIPGGREGPTLRYDNQTSLLTDSLTGQPVVKSFASLPSNKQVFATSKDTPARSVNTARNALFRELQKRTPLRFSLSLTDWMSG
jgi:hypothetical protein